MSLFYNDKLPYDMILQLLANLCVMIMLDSHDFARLGA